MATVGALPKGITVQNVIRLLAIWWALLREYRALRRFRRGAGNADAPARFAAHLVALGPTFVKLGQILSTRPDLLPQAYLNALSNLKEEEPEAPTERVRRTIPARARETGRGAVRQLRADARGPRPRLCRSTGRRFLRNNRSLQGPETGP